MIIKQQGQTTPHLSHTTLASLTGDQQAKSTSHLLPLHPNRIKKEQAMELTNEEFLQQFASLNSNQASDAPLQLGQSAFETRNWAKCALLRIVADRSPMLSQFSKIMVRAWEVHPQTTLTVVAKNLYLVHFNTEADLLKVINRGIWTYKNDMVILKRIYGPNDIAQPAR